jgi:Transposase IS66 family
MGSPYVRGDDTGIRVLDRDHPNGVKLGHLWAFVGTEDQADAEDSAAPQEAGVLVAFHYAPSWKAEHPQGCDHGCSVVEVGRARVKVSLFSFPADGLTLL